MTVRAQDSDDYADQQAERELRDRELEKVPPPIGPSDGPRRRDDAIEHMLAAREELRRDLGGGDLKVTGWLIVIGEETQDAARNATRMLLGEPVMSADGREECHRALSRLGAAAIEALVALDESLERSPLNVTNRKDNE